MFWMVDLYHLALMGLITLTQPRIRISYCWVNAAKQKKSCDDGKESMEEIIVKLTTQRILTMSK